MFRNSAFHIGPVSVFVAWLSLVPALALAGAHSDTDVEASVEAGAGEVAADGSTGDGTGTDPRDFAPKFMPYYR